MFWFFLKVVGRKETKPAETILNGNCDNGMIEFRGNSDEMFTTFG
jgi:hypothetical protein